MVPTSEALFPEMVLFWMSKVPVPKKYKPPPAVPALVAWFPEMVLFWTVRLPLANM